VVLVRHVKNKKRLTCKHQGFTFSTKETEFSDEKKVEKKGEPCNVWSLCSKKGEIGGLTFFSTFFQSWNKQAIPK
jgi:hypothetical protein